jgi:hypothetical protein
MASAISAWRDTKNVEIVKAPAMIIIKEKIEVFLVK